MWLVPASPFDMPAIAGPLSKDRREDLQVWGFLLAAAAQREGQHSLGVRRGEDPPDRYVQGPEREWSLELTELTLGDVRSELARARAVGRRLQEALRANPGRHGHLVGGRVVPSLLPEPDKPLPGDPASMIAALVDVLAEDQGCVADDVDLLRGLPKRVASQASELHKREIGIISFDCPRDNYSLFLWHEPPQRLLHERGLTLDGSGGFVVNMVVLGVLSGLLSALTYRYVERPALRRKTPAASPSQPTRPASRWRRSTGAAGGVQAIRHAW